VRTSVLEQTPRDGMTTLERLIDEITADSRDENEKLCAFRQAVIPCASERIAVAKVRHHPRLRNSGKS